MSSWENSFTRTVKERKILLLSARVFSKALSGIFESILRKT